MVPTGPPIASLRDLASLPNLRSFSLQRGGSFGLQDWTSVLLALGGESPQLVHLFLSGDTQDCFARAPLSVQVLADRYQREGGKPLSVRSLHLREGFHFLPPSAATSGITTDYQHHHPAPYLEQLLDPFLLESLSIHTHFREGPLPHGIPDHRYPVAWDILDPTVLPRLRSLWVDIIDAKGYHYLQNRIDADWLASIDVRIPITTRSFHETSIYHMAHLFAGRQHVGPTPRRARSILLSSFHGRDMATLESYGAVQHLSFRLPHVGELNHESLRSFCKLRDLESIHLKIDSSRKIPIPPGVPRFAEELASACPKLRYIRIDKYHRQSGGYRVRAWAVQRRGEGAVVRELGTLEELDVRPSVYNEAIEELETLHGYTLGRYIYRQ